MLVGYHLLIGLFWNMAVPKVSKVSRKKKIKVSENLVGLYGICHEKVMMHQHAYACTLVYMYYNKQWKSKPLFMSY